MPRTPRFYLISDRRRMGSDPIAAVLRLAAAGLPAFQWREKDLPAQDSYRFLSKLVAELRDAGATTQVVVNDRVDIALALGIGVHLPEEGLPTRVAREVLGPDALIGRSTHSLESARRARDDGADFVTFSPVYDTASKRIYGPPQGLEMLRLVARELGSFPVLALGGVTAARTSECLDAGAAGIAGIGAVWEAGDPVEAYAEFARALPSASAHPPGR
jgi:thiamine-phosphate pyrophosphorylase